MKRGSGNRSRGEKRTYQAELGEAQLEQNVHFLRTKTLAGSLQENNLGPSCPSSNETECL